MDSFYGGKQGISFVIKEKFKTIADMNEHLEDSTYDKVWYGEYCIIQTDSINDKDNGKIFRRTASHASQNIIEGSYDCAEYIGRIVGPAGGIPNVQLGDIPTVQADFMTAATKEHGSFYYQTPTTVTIEEQTVSTYAYVSNTPATASDLYINSITPGIMYKSGKEYASITTGTDGIETVVNAGSPMFKYGFYTFQSNDTTGKGTDRPLATLGIGFEIPYVDFIYPTVSMVSQTTKPTIDVTTYNPFLYGYHFNLPAGGTGPYIGNVHIVEPIATKQDDEGNTITYALPIYDIDRIDYVPGRTEPGEYQLKLTDEEIEEEITTVPFHKDMGTHVIVGEFIYLNGEDWVSGKTGTDSDLFYLGEAPFIDNIVTQYDTKNEQYAMYAKINGLKGEHTIEISPDNKETGYKYIGFTGPKNLGPFTRQLEGYWTNEGTAESPSYKLNIISDGPTWTGDPRGNLGVITTEQANAVAKSQDPPEDAVENNGNGNNVYFFIWSGNLPTENPADSETDTPTDSGTDESGTDTETGEWVQLGTQQLESIYIQTNLNGFNFTNSQDRVTFNAEAQQNKPDGITIDTFKEMPWK